MVPIQSGKVDQVEGVGDEVRLFIGARKLDAARSIRIHHLDVIAPLSERRREIHPGGGRKGLLVRLEDDFVPSSIQNRGLDGYSVGGG